MFRYQASRCLLVACLSHVKRMNMADSEDMNHAKGRCVQCSDHLSCQINWKELFARPSFRDYQPYQVSLSEEAAWHHNDPLKPHKEDLPNHVDKDSPKKHTEDLSDGECIKMFDWRELSSRPVSSYHPYQVSLSEEVARSIKDPLKQHKVDLPNQLHKDSLEQNTVDLSDDGRSKRFGWRKLLSRPFSSYQPDQVSLSEEVARHGEDPRKRHMADLPKHFDKDSPKQHTADLSDGGRIKRFDWREHGAITPVRDQKDCGCCYAIASMGAIEALGKITTGVLVELSVQQILDCDLKSMNDGCYGGNPWTVFQYVMKFGVTTEKLYPFTSWKVKRNRKYQPVHKRYKKCKKVNPDTAAYITGFQFVERFNGDALEAAVLINPVVLSISVNEKFREYKGGILTTHDCPPPSDRELMDSSFRVHNVLLIGFDEDEKTGIRFWVLKNSWGVGWGENGYFKVLRDVHHPWGVLGINASRKVYPTGYIPIPPSPAATSSCFFGNIGMKVKDLLQKVF